MCPRPTHTTFPFSLYVTISHLVYRNCVFYLGTGHVLLLFSVPLPLEGGFIGSWGLIDDRRFVGTPDTEVTRDPLWESRRDPLSKVGSTVIIVITVGRVERGENTSISLVGSRDDGK